MIQCENCGEKFYSPEEHHSLSSCQRKTIKALKNAQGQRECHSHAEFARFVQEATDMRAERDALAVALADLIRRLHLPNGVTCRVCMDSWLPGEHGIHHDWCPLHGLTPSERGQAILEAAQDGENLLGVVHEYLIAEVFLKHQREPRSDETISDEYRRAVKRFGRARDALITEHDRLIVSRRALGVAAPEGATGGEGG